MNSRRSARSKTSTIFLPSSQRVAIGFSQTTWRPACAAWIACAGWSPLGVAMTTTSLSACASSASSEA